MSRNFVHLSDNEETAIKVGSRHGEPIVAVIDTVRMVEDGYCFYNPVGHTWLVSRVPREYFGWM